ncbi:MAG: TlpA disulfide reductase family protein [Bacteroidales bacterium]
MRRKLIQALFIFLAGTFVLSCSSSSERKVVFQGEIHGSEVSRLTLYELGVKESHALHTQVLKKNGRFQFETESKEAGFYYLETDNHDYMVLIGAPGERISIEAESWSLSQSAVVSGSPETGLLQTYRKAYYENLNKLAALNRILIHRRMEEDYAEVHDSIAVALNALFLRQQQLAEDFIRLHPGSLAALLVVNDKFGKQQLFNDAEHQDLFILIDEGLQENYPGNMHTLEHHERVNGLISKVSRGNAISVGQPSPVFCLPSNDGVEKCLNDFSGKVVLIDFWASWCMSCRKANPVRKTLYEKYNRHGFEIFGVSFDTEGEKWLSAVQEDGLVWPQVSDMKGLQSPVMKLFGLEKIPANVLLNRQGEIVAIDLPSETLENTIKTLL